MRVLQVFGAKAWRIQSVAGGARQIFNRQGSNRFTPLLVVDVDKPALTFVKPHHVDCEMLMAYMDSPLPRFRIRLRLRNDAL